MRKVGLLLAVTLVLCLAASAQERAPADVFLGYSYVRAHPQSAGFPDFNLHGGSAAVAFNPSRYFGIVGDFGGYHARSAFSFNNNLYTYMAGPRVTYRNFGKVTPFAQALFGGAHLTGPVLGTSGSRNAFAMTAGGGLDINATNRVALRLIQAEYFLTRFREFSRNDRLNQHNMRLSTGVVFRW